MKKPTSYRVALVTAPDLRVARRLAQSALKARLVACANLVLAVESHYWWQGRLDQSKEVLIIFKTTTQRLAALETLVLAKHPYDTPEFIVLPIAKGNRRYLEWISKSVCAKSR